MADNKIAIKSMINAQVGVNLREINRRFNWPRKGAVVKVSRDDFDVMFYDIGFTNMVKAGVLFIEDMELKKEIGLEPEDANAPVNLIELSDNYIKRLVTVMPINEFKTVIKGLSDAQHHEIAAYMVQNNSILSIDRINAMKEITGIDVMQGIRMKNANDEPDPEPAKEG